MKNITKITAMIIIISVLTFSLTGCFADQGLETLTYVIALGIDVGSNDNNLKVSLQFAIPESSSNGSSQSGTSKTMSMEASTISEAVSLMNGYTSKKIDLSHCKIIVFSEKIATKGISNHISSLINNIEIRPDCNVIVSRCDAEDFLNNSTPSLDKLTARYYEVLLNSKEYTGYTIEMPIGKFFSNLADSSSEATAILGGITLENATPNNANEYKANELPIKNTRRNRKFRTCCI